MTVLTVYVFFATWCVPCRQELAHIAQLERTLAARGVTFVLVSEDAPSTAGNLPAFLARFGFREGVKVVLDEESELLQKYNPAAGIPFTAVVDGSGKVVFAHAGYEPGDERTLEAVLLSRLDAAAPPSDGRPTVSLTTRDLGIARRDDFGVAEDSRAWVGVGRLDGAVRGPWWAAGLRVDGSLVDHATRPRTEDARIEKAAVEVWGDHGRLLAGDQYAAFGNGLLLSVRRIDLLGVDTTIRGGRVEGRLGPIEAVALGGRFNPQNVDPIDLRPVDDVPDWTGGLEVREKLTAEWTLGQAAAFVRSGAASPTGTRVDTSVASAWLALAARNVRSAFEAAVSRRSGMSADGRDETGHGLYGRLSFDAGPVTTLIEAKWYRRFELRGSRPNIFFSEPPTLERDDQEIPGNADSAGARTRVDVRVLPTTTVFANALGYRLALDGSDPTDGGLVVHGYTGVDSWTNSGLSGAVSVGYRRETTADGEPRLSMAQANADAGARLGRWALTGKWDHRWETKELFSGPNRFVKGLVVVGASWASKLVLSALYGYSTEAAARPTHYPGAELRVVFGRHGDVRLFAGRMVGGRVCVSGACRDVPPFEGARIDLELRF